MVKQRFSFEQEVDKKAKALMVDSIQFRNSFDTEGPLIPGLTCEEAMEKLGVCVCLCLYMCVFVYMCMCVFVYVCLCVYLSVCLSLCV